MGQLFSPESESTLCLAQIMEHLNKNILKVIAFFFSNIKTDQQSQEILQDISANKLRHVHKLTHNDLQRGATQRP